MSIVEGNSKGEAKGESVSVSSCRVDGTERPGSEAVAIYLKRDGVDGCQVAVAWAPRKKSAHVNARMGVELGMRVPVCTNCGVKTISRVDARK
jgi:hypothetical protein